MKELATEKIDFLTGCYMREGLPPYVDKLVAESKAYNREFAILLLDIDHFKAFNDKYGHLDGDQVLKYFSSSLRLDLSMLDCAIFRFGGDEFVIIFPGKGIKEVKDVARMLQATLNSRPFLLGGKLFKMSFSGGIVSGSKDGDNLDQLFVHADKAMYVSKRLGRARTIVYSKIWLAYVYHYTKAIALVAGLLILAAAAFFFIKTPMPKISFAILQPQTQVQAKVKAAAVPQVKQEIVKVSLMSGAVIKGKILKENAREIEVGLALEKGEGAVTIQKDIIKRIDRE